jgi:hypothetical protein
LKSWRAVLVAEHPLDPAADEALSIEDTIPKEEVLAHYMASLGFRPKTPRATDTLEFFKTYSDPSGRVGRVVTVIKKDEVGLDPESVDYFTVTVQFHIPAVDAEAKVKAPPFCRQDILRILAHFDAANDRHEADVVECALCGMSCAEYQPRGDDKVCLDCAQRKGPK